MFFAQDDAQVFGTFQQLVTLTSNMPYDTFLFLVQVSIDRKQLLPFFENIGMWRDWVSSVTGRAF